MTPISDLEILDGLTMPGLNVEATLEPRELTLLLYGIRNIIARRERLVEQVEREKAARELQYYRKTP
jgi:hypothetical protein